MAVINAWDSTGANGNLMVLPGGGIGTLRTGAGKPARTIIVIAKFDSVATGDRQTLFQSKRASNEAFSFGFRLRDSNDSLESAYGLNALNNTAASSIAAATWYAFCYCDAGNNGDITVRIIPLSTATQSDSAPAAAPGVTSTDDDNVQEQSLMGYEAGGVVDQEGDMQVAIILGLQNTSLSQAECEAFTANPLVYGDSLVGLHGTNSWLWDDSGSDSGPNAAGAPTLLGTVTRGTGNGPDIPARSVASLLSLIMSENIGKVLVR